VEGAFIQGLGYLTSEEVVVDESSGRLISDGTWTYKIPSAACIPQKMNVEFLKVIPRNRSLLQVLYCKVLPTHPKHHRHP